jgi:threonine dehydrogenase-like Zn-dependent dehydrogenase
LLDLSTERLAMAVDKFGFDSGHTSADAAIKAMDGEGYDVLFDATGYGGAIEAGFPAVAHGGSYVLVSVVKDDITFNDPEFHKREMRLIGSRNALKADFDWVMSAFRDNLIDADAFCSNVISLGDLTTAFGELAAGRAGLIKAIVQLND